MTLARAAFAHRIRTMFACIDQGAWEDLPSHFTSDCVYERPGYPSIQGIAALTTFYRDVRRIASGRHQVDVLIIEGAHVLAAGRFDGTLRDGSPAAAEFADLYHVRAGRVAHRRTYFHTPLI